MSKQEFIGWVVILVLLIASCLEINRLANLNWPRMKKSKPCVVKAKPSVVTEKRSNSPLWVDKCCNSGTGKWWCDCR